MKFSSSVSLLFIFFTSTPIWAQVMSKQAGQNPGQQGIVKPAAKPASPSSVTPAVVPNHNPGVSPSSSPANNPAAVSAPIAAKKKINSNGIITLDWRAPGTYQADENSPVVTYLNLRGALYVPKNHSLPEVIEQIKLNPGFDKATAYVVNTKYEPLTEAELKALGDNKKWVASDIAPAVRVVTAKKEFYVNISFIPVRKNAQTNTYEKLVSFSLDIHQSKVPGNVTKKAAISYAANSVLSNGTWYRIGVTADGIYELNAAFFVKAGIDTAKLIPANIRIYGNGGAMLPQSNAVYRPDDLIENAIYVKGQNDTSFKKNDYVLFYGQSPNVWTYDSADGHFHHTVNVYSDTTFYFINIDLGPGKRISNAALASGTPTNTVNAFDDYAFHELDGVNLILSGCQWMGEFFETTTQYSFSFPFPNISNSGPVYVNAAIASRNCQASSVYTVSSGAKSVTQSIAGVPCGGIDQLYAIDTPFFTYTYTPVQGASSVPVTATKQTPGAVGWVYYIETNVRRSLTLPGSQNQMEFRDTKSAGAGNTSLFTISTFTPINVWDITNPQNIDSVHLLPGSSNYSFEVSSNTMHQYIAFTGKSGSFLTPVYFGKVANQDLHAMAQADLIIVTNPLFLEEADQLANFHRSHDGLAVNVATTQQVYNEFSSGAQDPTAIRDFLRMFYDRSKSYTDAPKYLLLFGGGSYDPKHRTSGNTNYVVAYESTESFNPIGSYVSDDYFVLLDSSVTTAPEYGPYPLDMAVGRFTVDNKAEAQTCVNKVMIYETPTGQSVSTMSSCCNTQNQYTLGNWRNTICFIAHDGESNDFEFYSQDMANYVQANYKNLNVNKIYPDAYQMVQTPGGPRYPTVNVAIDNQMNAGLLVYNFEGHGGPTGLGYERILDFNDIDSWTNLYAMPLFFNGSCAFGEWDDPLQISGGQLSVNLTTGGVIGMISATRGVYLQPNAQLNEVFIDSLYSPLPDGTLPRIGDLLSMAENGNGGGTNLNNLTFSLVGDPAVRLDYPKYNIKTTSVTTNTNDTLKALDKVTVSGYIADNAGNPLSSFNGLLYPTIYDKPDSVTTLANLGPQQSAYGPSYPLTFGIQNSELYKGLISVSGGKFTFTYIMPKDILYYYGPGKISYYAENGTTDATGNDENIIVGGTSPAAHNNGIGPKLRLYMNDSNFVYDGLTNQNPSLYAVVFDSNGINTSQSSIGHGITAVLDNNTANTYDVTNYYQPELNSYQKGTITFPFNSLSNGTHTLTLRVWNVYDNTSVATTEFNVEPQSNLQLQHVLNYPDPFTTHTEFMFDINEVCDQMDVQIQVFSVSGKLVRNILTSVKTDSFHSDPINWDGRDDYGDRLAKGVYIYHIRVRTSSGQTADTYQKLVIL